MTTDQHQAPTATQDRPHPEQAPRPAYAVVAVTDGPVTAYAIEGDDEEWGVFMFRADADAMAEQLNTSRPARRATSAASGGPLVPIMRTATAGVWEDAEVIHAYTRRQALLDGVLVAVPPATSAEAGYGCPVAVTAAAWADCVAWSQEIEAAKGRATCQDQAGRLWDVLQMARGAILRAGHAERVQFTVVRVPPTGRGRRPRPAQLVVHIGPGDGPSRVITIMQPGED